MTMTRKGRMAKAPEASADLLGNALVALSEYYDYAERMREHGRGFEPQTASGLSVQWLLRSLARDTVLRFRNFGSTNGARLLAECVRRWDF